MTIAVAFAGGTDTKFLSQVYLDARIHIHKFRMYTLPPPLITIPHTQTHTHIHSYHKPQVEDYQDHLYAPRRRRGDQYEILAETSYPISTPIPSRSEYGSV